MGQWYQRRSALPTTPQHEIHDPDRRLLGCCRRCSPGQPSHRHLETIAEPRHGETRVLLQLRGRERHLRQRERIQKQIGEESGTVSQGRFSYPEDSKTYTITWVADENGFQATGDHLPTPPPMPAHVVKLLADLAAAGKL